MSKALRYVLAVAFGLGFGYAFVARLAIADTTQLTQSTAINFTRACRFTGGTQKIAVSGTSAASTQLQGGVERVLCTTDVHLKQATTSPTATTNDMLVQSGSELYLWSNRDYVALIQDSASGTCYVTDCL